MPAGAAAAQAPERLAERQNLLQLVQLRWLAVVGQLATILVVQLRAGRAAAAGARC